ncbi:replication protein [Rodentibacter pneumotropicus]|uniref:Replication protein n=2 Tax=Rodentibacter pneumotropicus TaxID=758 RepID=A0A4S2Q5L1_9PAST|nr:replication protein [Rodentibacter pneumotropicus]THA00748.1 replication protein [Rodentibacter pneumotropicus]THA07005.1 replication protein [Rodentibacter pneumotropicus]THA11930.1 replication protein [Rodentibacter pneumotropicus]
MSNVVTIEALRLQQVAKEKIEQQGAKKVSVDDGFIQIPRELYLAIAKFPFTKHQRAVIDAVIIKCLGYHKEMDWIGNGQIVDLTSIGYECKASTAKQELIRMNVLVQKGNSIGFNLVISEWKNSDLPKQEKIYRNGKNKLTETVNSDLPKQENTKETITKEKINNNPQPPCGESANAEPSAEADLQNESTLEEKTKSDPVDYVGVAEAYNQAVEESQTNLSFVADPNALSDKRKRAVKKLSTVFKKRFGDGSVSAIGEYFADFLKQAPPFYFGKNNRGWKADFEYLLRESTLDKVLEGNL